jgi:GGDEF domain-containing protein
VPDDSKTLKLLLVEDNLEDEQFLSEAILEIEETHQWCNWHGASIVHVGELGDAIDCLRGESYVAILLNLSLPDSPMLLETFQQVIAAAGGTPIVVLADENDPGLANLLLRAGAQDVLVKSELECGPLARAIRYSVERQRRTTQLKSSPFADDLTGALTRPSFFTLATHSVQLAGLSRMPLLMASVEVKDIRRATQQDRESGDLLILRSAEALRAVFGPPTLIGRLGPTRFGLVTAGLTVTTVEALLNRAALAIEAAGRSDGQPESTVRFNVSQICEETSLEEMLGRDGDDFAARTHRRAKTVMLAD